MKSDECVQVLKVLADETRWQIVRELLAQSLNVTELVQRLGVSQYNISKHLRILREAGIVEAVRRGRCVECHIVAGFRQQLSRNRSQLDFGCCSFNFDTLGT